MNYTTLMESGPTSPAGDIPETPVRLGISTCLLGERVRYDGGHKLDPFLRDTLGRFVEFIPVCPEMECGLPVPREAMHLVGDSTDQRLVTIRTGHDITPRMVRWGQGRLGELERLGLDGYIFKSKSPSSGMERIRVYYDTAGHPIRSDGVGIWAHMVMERFPLMPAEDEGRLHDPGLREHFIERVFVHRRWRHLLEAGVTRGGLVEFHTRHKLLVMAHSPQLARELGRIVAGPEGISAITASVQYIEALTRTLQLKATVKKHVNVLQHIMGYFKHVLTTDEKREFLDIIEAYHHALVPLIVPVTIANHYVRKYCEPYLARQYYLNPHPLELRLRNHV